MTGARCVLAGLLAALALQAGGQTFDSGPRAAALLELYTSEGCSSCPPADAWLRGLVHAPALWRDVVPLAFHVDYWDDLGWPDRYASAAHTARQREYRTRGVLRQVYTPGFVHDGREWRGFFSGESLPDRPARRPGPLRVTLAAGLAQVRFEPADGGEGGWRVHVARLGSGLSTAVARGENAGRRLAHDFVVLALRSSALAPADGAWSAAVPLPAAAAAPREALAIWVTRGADPRPVQATGGWLSGNAAADPPPAP